MANKGGQKPDPLPQLVDQLLAAAHAAGEAAGNLDDEEMLRGPFWGAQLMYGPGVEAAAVRVLTALGQQDRFEGAEEVTAFVLDQLQEFCTVQDKDPDTCRTLIAESLRSPHRSWQFSFFLRTQPSFYEMFDLPILLGGPNAFSLHAFKDDASAVILTGQVAAPTPEGVAVRFERLLDTLLGASRALGLADFTKGRNPQDTRVRVLIGEKIAPPLASLYGDRVGGIRLTGPRHLSDLEVKQKHDGDPKGAGRRHLKLLQTVLGGYSERARDVRAACRLAINAEDALDFGIVVTLAFTCLEGLLLQKESTADVLARISEAVAYLLASSAIEVQTLRKTVKALYDIRSRFAHTGEAMEKVGARADVMGLLYRVIQKQIEQLPQPETESIVVGEPAKG